MPLMRVAYVVVVGLVLAGLVHIGSLLGVPRYATQGPLERIAALGPEGAFVTLADEGDAADLLPFRDPAFVTAACRYDLSSGPVAVTAPLPSTYGAISVHARAGQPFYALTDRAATGGRVEITILAKDDVAAAEQEEPSEESRPKLKIVSPTETGFILVRLFAPGESARPALRDLAAKATCAKVAPSS
ncbi:DUF1254 domain-containing protein [Chenggangzhangella methanolivorans]|uniref:DUF1254 domain-containing protein n=1 Tax=Chenggangzhangella methanolivorans TaxID=1437009 RepID=A0A9E6RGX2_9HYPH|nr:DUF1254 domain-containing protein [Chenggangzhangella methanolivorans]QZO00817.1 DUF1254 domain-containing protein [Chenggangzhangella methanolivorans]